ncbi:hypothetical protein D3C87_1916210 [compost metagenome]
MLLASSLVLLALVSEQQVSPLVLLAEPVDLYPRLERSVFLNVLAEVELVDDKCYFDHGELRPDDVVALLADQRLFD